LAMRFLLTCYREHGQGNEALDMCEQLRLALSTLGGQGLGLLHPLMKWLDATQDELKQQEAQNCQQPNDANQGDSYGSVRDSTSPLPQSHVMASKFTDREEDGALLAMASQVRSKTY